MIRIQNLYYMLAYAFQILNEKRYENCMTEKFENTADLLSAILAKGIEKQIKHGLGREYLEETDSLSCLRGKVNVSDTIKYRTLLQQKMICTYDEFSVNTYQNRILRTTIQLLLKQDIAQKRKKELRNLLLYFSEVDILNPKKIEWHIQYNRNNQTYRMLIAICYLIIKGLLQTTSDGTVKMMQYLDDQHMCRLYEKFILEYYRKHYPQLGASSSTIVWALDNDFDFLLPKMKSDIMLSYGHKTLIIDAKYYSDNLQKHYNIHSIHSGNLYQIFAYVKNKAQQGGEVSGMLLYAKTDAMIQPNQTYQMSGNQISAKTLDLDCDFNKIKIQLDSIVEDCFGSIMKTN